IVIAIIAVLLGLIMTAAQKVRAAADRMACSGNLHQLGLAVLNFESAYAKFPSPGEGLVPGASAKDYDVHSFFTYILPFVEQDNVYKTVDLGRVYNDSAAPGNQIAARTEIRAFMCPGAAGVQPDPRGYGQTAYMPVSYTDIDPITGLRNTATRVPGT